MSTKIVLIGLGYVGLPLASVLASTGKYEVVGVDINKDIINDVNSGMLKYSEDEFKSFFKEWVVGKNIHAQDKPVDSDVFIICVPTPQDQRKRVADLSYVISAIKIILPFLKPGNLIVIESTIPPLTCRNVILPIIEESGFKVGHDVFLAHCPERILPGNVLKEIIYNDRIIGGYDDASSIRAKEIYSSFVRGEIYVTNDITAELVKIMENTYRDVNIALANEFAAVSETLGVDVIECIKLANKHPRVNILKPGIGTGGHCIPVDPWFIHEVDPANSRLVYTARAINEEVPYRIASKVRRSLRDLQAPRIIALGVTFKPDTYDTRNSPALKIIRMLKEDGYNITAHDPLAKGYNYSSIEDLAKDADCLLVLVEHSVIKQELNMKEESITKAMRNPIILRYYSDLSER